MARKLKYTKENFLKELSELCKKYKKIGSDRDIAIGEHCASCEGMYLNDVLNGYIHQVVHYSFDGGYQFAMSEGEELKSKEKKPKKSVKARKKTTLAKRKPGRPKKAK
jgi:hypothetical protein